MNKNQLKKLGAISAGDRVIVPRIIMSISALEKQGKTHFSLTAPAPSVIFSTDIGEEGVVHKFGDKDINIIEIANFEEGNDVAAEKEWDRYLDTYNAFLNDKDTRTIIIDTATEIWELIRLARFGRLTQVMPYQYGPVNKEFRSMIRKAYDFDKNVVFLHKMRPQYVNDKWNGEYERSGFNTMGFLVQVNAQMYRYSQEDGGEFVLWVKDCRQNPDMADMELEGDMCNFPTMASMVLPEVDPEVWE